MSLASNPEKRADDSSCEKNCFFHVYHELSSAKIHFRNSLPYLFLGIFHLLRCKRKEVEKHSLLPLLSIIFVLQKLIKNKPSDISTKSESSLSVILVTRKFFISNGPIEYSCADV